jgi:hypothetical protein
MKTKKDPSQKKEDHNWIFSIIFFYQNNIIFTF